MNHQVVFIVTVTTEDSDERYPTSRERQTEILDAAIAGRLTGFHHDRKTGGFNVTNADIELKEVLT